MTSYRPPILSIDPGREGSFCLANAEGTKFKFWEMPLIGGKITSVGVANVYNDIAKLCKEPPKVYIEKVQAMKHDGKVGMSSYFLGAGYLEMCALWGWPIVRVPPVTWCKAMHASLSQKMHPKEKTLLWISQHYPELYQKGSDIWPERRKKPHSGHADAFIINAYARLKEYG